MTESLKLAEIHRTGIEYERQRHLANWLVKSSPHMAKPSTSNKSHTLLTKNGTNTQNPLFFLGQASHGNFAMSRTPLFNSQTNLPLQIVASQEGHKPKLRRFNSHDTSANMFSVADFENARLTRRNELEIKQRQQNRYKMNSLSSGGDCSTGDSKGSKFSNDSNPELLPADVFLDRFSLPRVVRITTTRNLTNETIQSSSSNGSTSSSNKRDLQISKPNGELFLLFRNVKNRQIYHGLNTKNGSARKKGIMIPQEFSGYFSVINDKGAPAATMYTTLVQLVRERVYKFLSVDNLPAYSETQNADNFPSRPHYVKGTARGGQIFRLLAVFEDGKQESNQSASVSTKNSSNPFREKEKGRYAQLLNENRQIVYVSLTTKGKFYEIEQTTPQILQKNNTKPATTPKPFNSDCVHRLNNITLEETELPVTLRFISGPQGSGNVVPENFTVTKITSENIIVGCPIEEPEARSPLHLRKLLVTPEMRLIKCFLGFENEQKLFSNQSIQNILKFCQINYDNFSRLVEFEYLNNSKGVATDNSKPKSEGLKMLNPLNFPRLLRRERSMIAHQKEDSIIFLSKNDLDNLEHKEQERRDEQANGSDKFKMFQTTKKKWFRNSKSTSKNNSLASFDMDVQNKRMSLDRYQDMSKLLQERFGDEANVNHSNEQCSNIRSSSEIGIDPKREIDQTDLRQKSMSLQEMDSRSDFTNKPDLVRIDFDLFNNQQGQKCKNIVVDNDVQDISLVSFSNQQSFITEKLYSEFHVKTKHHSKSSSNLHQLLHFAVPQKMNINETKKKINENQHKSLSNTETVVFTDKIQTYDDDLPYSNVRDSLLIQSSQTPTETSSHHENIYAEICSDGQASSMANSTVRISIGTNHDVGLSRRYDRDGGAYSDNIYNTLN